ncbi:MAG: CUB domain-containing protein [Candidatus Thiodiazotropha sp.]
MCGGQLSDSTGWIQSINGERGDGWLEKERACLWTLLAAADSAIELQFHYFDLKFHYVCGKDFVQVC